MAKTKVHLEPGAYLHEDPNKVERPRVFEVSTVSEGLIELVNVADQKDRRWFTTQQLGQAGLVPIRRSG